MRISVFDIGGTFIKHGIFDGSRISAFHQIPTEASLGVDHLIRTLTHILQSDRSSAPLNGVGISTRGQVDAGQGLILYDPPEIIPGYTGTNLCQRLQAALDSPDLPVAVENDGNCAALAENLAGAARMYDDCLCVVFGTAIGGAIISGRQIYHGCNYSAGEFGMMLLPDGNGGHMYYERYASVAQLIDLASAADPSLTDGRRIAAALASASTSAASSAGNDSAVSAAVDTWCRRAALGLASLIHVFNPPCLVLGGGIMESEEIFCRLRRETKALPAPGFQQAEIQPAALGNQAGLLGAGYLAARLGEIRE